MSSWRRPTRLGVGIFGVGFAMVVYLAIGERKVTAPPAAVERFDPRAVLESTRALLQQVRGTEQDFEVTAARTLSFEDGSTKQFGVRITVRNRNGRDFVVTTREAQAGQNQRELQLTGEVKLLASDGFELATERATFNQDDGIVRAPGGVSFGNARMKGSGVGMTYDRDNEVLRVLDQPQITMRDTAGSTVLSFGARTAALDRVQDFVTLDGLAHVLRGEQTLESDVVTARLSTDEQVVTLIELRGRSRVAGGKGAFDAMTANDIDLDYTDDGQALERAALSGKAAVTLAPGKARSGRQLTGDTLSFQLAPDGSITHASGRDAVRFDLPAGPTAPGRRITSKTFDASGQTGAGLTDARFVDDVEYRELGGGESPSRVARSRTLQIVLGDDDVRSALFAGGVTFEAQTLTAVAGEARYAPGQGTLTLTRADAAAVPRVTDDQIMVTAPAIDVALETRRIDAHGGVKTTLLPRETGPRGTPRERAGRLPGLLQQDTPANVNATRLLYEGASGSAVYSGHAALWQGDTAIRGDVLEIDQENGDLVATGLARSTLVLDGSLSSGRAHEIRYRHAQRTIAYESLVAAAAPVRVGTSDDDTPGGSTSDVGPPPPPQAQLTGPPGDIRADRIEVLLAARNSRAQRLDAFTNVRLKLDDGTATGAHLTYHADDERYVLIGSATAPVKVAEACRETVGKTLTFFRSTDRIVVDGNEEIRAQTTGGGPCPQPYPR